MIKLCGLRCKNLRGFLFPSIERKKKELLRVVHWTFFIFFYIQMVFFRLLPLLKQLRKNRNFFLECSFGIELISFSISWLDWIWLSSNNLYLIRVNLFISHSSFLPYAIFYVIFHAKVIYLNITWQKPFAGWTEKPWIIAQCLYVCVCKSRPKISSGQNILRWVMNFTQKASIDSLRVMHK